MCFRPPPYFTVLAAMASSCISGNSQPDELVEQFFDHTDEPMEDAFESLRGEAAQHAEIFGPGAAGFADADGASEHAGPDVKVRQKFREHS